VIHRLSWVAVGRAMCAALRAIAGPTLPLASLASVGRREPSDTERMAAEIEAFLLALQADLIRAEDFAD
jgi:hypothetical protein